jgi:hypothetical protein
VKTRHGRATVIDVVYGRESDPPPTRMINHRDTNFPRELAKMSDTTFAPESISAPIPVREILLWAIFAAVALLAIYFVGAEEGATSLIPGMYVHEFVHDGRHLLGFPCH